MSKINFTPEHQNTLNGLLLEALTEGTLFEGRVGTTTNVFDLIHNCTLNTLQKMNITLGDEITKKSKLDEWSLTDYQQKQIKELEKKKNLVNLMIGYKKAQSEKNVAKEKLSDLKSQLTELEESKKTPDEKLAEIRKAIAETEAVI